MNCDVKIKAIPIIHIWTYIVLIHRSFWKSNTGIFRETKAHVKQVLRFVRRPNKPMKLKQCVRPMMQFFTYEITIWLFRLFKFSSQWFKSGFYRDCNAKIYLRSTDVGYVALYRDLTFMSNVCNIENQYAFF